MRAFRGDVVLVDFPFASGAAQKLRPAVVVQSDLYNRKLATTIPAPITSNTKHTGEPTQIAVDPTTADGSQTGLLRPSAIKCENLATVESRLIRRKIGTTSAALLPELDTALKAALGIS
jgi:mRNA-degrading endonuclease toxin of MazEF toxin-antitoxin module